MLLFFEVAALASSFDKHAYIIHLKRCNTAAGAAYFIAEITGMLFLIPLSGEDRPIVCFGPYVVLNLRWLYILKHSFVEFILLLLSISCQKESIVVSRFDVLLHIKVRIDLLIARRLLKCIDLSLVA